MGFLQVSYLLNQIHIRFFSITPTSLIFFMQTHRPTQLVSFPSSLRPLDSRMLASSFKRGYGEVRDSDKLWIINRTHHLYKKHMTDAERKIKEKHVAKLFYKGCGRGGQEHWPVAIPLMRKSIEQVSSLCLSPLILC